MKRILSALKFKTVALLTITVAAIALATGSTIAFFNAQKETVGVFTAGSVSIELTEATVTRDALGNLVEDTTKDRISGAEISGSAAPVVNDYGVVFPGQTICKDPTIKNTGSDEAWIAAKVIIEDGACDIHRLFGYDGFEAIDVELLLRGGLLDETVHFGTWSGIDNVCYNDNYAMIQTANSSEGRYEFFFIMLNPLSAGETVEIFDTVFFDNTFENDDMMEFKELKITVQAFAVQHQGFRSCLDAMNGAFPEHFLNRIGQ